MPAGAVAIGLGVAAGTAYGANRQAGAATQAARMQMQASNQAATLQSRAAQQQLDFLKQQDARNNAQYLEEQGYTRGQTADAIARKEPFRQVSLGAISALSRPLNQRPLAPPAAGSITPAQPGTLGAAVR